MIKRSRDKLDLKKQISAPLRDEVKLELDDIVSFMEAIQAIKDNMATFEF
jgi:hypothetical protein